MINNSIKMRRRNGILLAMLGACLWGIMGIFVKELSTAGYSSYDIAFLRCLLAGIGYFTIKAIKDPEILKIDIKGFFICLLYGILAYAMGFVCYGIALQRIPVAVATVLMFMSPVWVAILGVFIFHEKLTVKTIIIIGLCILGATMVSDVFSSSNNRIDFLGILAGVVNGFGVALQIMIPRYYENRYKRDTMLVYGFLGAALGLSIFADFNCILSSFRFSDVGNVLLNIVCLGLLCTMVANVSMVKATEYIETTTCSILSSLEVVVGAFVGVLIFKETMSWVQILGAIIVVLGSLGPTLLESKQPNIS